MQSAQSETAESQYTVLSPGTPPQADGKAAVRKFAVFITHGMGQQVPFATLDAVFEQLRRLPPFSSARPEAETVRLGRIAPRRRMNCFSPRTTRAYSN